MRVKKQKRNRRTVKFFSACFGFREPFKVLCDGTFIHHLLVHRLLPADDTLSKFLGAGVTLFSSRCITAELRSLGESHLESLEASQQLIAASCDHEKRVSAVACIESIIAEGNSKHFFVATQDVDLRRKLREAPGVPIIYGLQNSLFIEQPSTAQREFAKRSGEKRLHASESEMRVLEREVKDGQPGEAVVAPDQITRRRNAKRKLDSAEKSKFKRKRAKGPNPLSCLKKKKPKESPLSRPNKEGAAPSGERKRRRRKKELGRAQGSVN